MTKLSKDEFPLCDICGSVTRHHTDEQLAACNAERERRKRERQK